jgi:hypothetical protein
MTATSKTSREKTSKPRTAAKLAEPVSEGHLRGRQSVVRTQDLTPVNWVHLHFTARRGYKRVHVGHKYEPVEHAALCKQLKDGTLGGGYYMQIENPAAPPGSLWEVLHPQDVSRVNFDQLDEFVAQCPATETHDFTAEVAAADSWTE